MKSNRGLTVAALLVAMATVCFAQNPMNTKVGVFRYGYYWVIDVNGDRTFGGLPDRAYAFGDPYLGDIPVTGNWSACTVYNGISAAATTGTRSGVLRTVASSSPTGYTSTFLLDSCNNGTVGIYYPGFMPFQATVKDQYGNITTPGDIPVSGDWTGSGYDQYRSLKTFL